MSRLVTVAVILCAIGAAATTCPPDLAFCGSEGATVADCENSAVAIPCPRLCGICSLSPTAAPYATVLPQARIVTEAGALKLQSTVGIFANGENLTEIITGYHGMSTLVDILNSQVAAQSSTHAAELESTVETLRNEMAAAVNSLTHAPSTAPTTSSPTTPSPTTSPTTPSPTTSPTTSACTNCRNCYAHKVHNPGLQSGVYEVFPSTGRMNVYCDMTADGGGWTLVFHENQPRSCQLTQNNEGGQRTCGMANSPILASQSSGSAKYADTVINALKTDASARQRFRVTSHDIPNRYFFPGECAYRHHVQSSSPCQRYSASFSGTNTRYIQCDYWGGHSGGLNAWYNCATNGQYTNVAVTHRHVSYSQSSGITTNYGGGQRGSSNTVYHNDVLMWVK